MWDGVKRVGRWIVSVRIRFATPDGINIFVGNAAVEGNVATSSRFDFPASRRGDFACSRKEERYIPRVDSAVTWRVRFAHSNRRCGKS